MANRPLNVVRCHSLILTFHVAKTFYLPSKNPSPLCTTWESVSLCLSRLITSINDFQWVVKKTLTRAACILYFLRLSARHKDLVLWGCFLPARVCHVQGLANVPLPGRVIKPGVSVIRSQNPKAKLFLDHVTFWHENLCCRTSEECLISYWTLHNNV